MKESAEIMTPELSFWKDIVRWISWRTPDFPTKRRWLGWVFGKELKSMEKTALNLMGTAGLKLEISPGSIMGQEMLMDGLYEKALAARFLNTIKPGDLVVDIGANLGQYTLLAAQKVGAKGLVISIEPVPHVVRQLKHHVTMNGFTNVQVVQAALGAEDGYVNMTVIADENDGMHHVALEAGENVTRVPLRRLDSLLLELAPNRSVSVLKIDVEGWEESVFAGAEQIFQQRKLPTIFFESIAEHANRFGFDIQTVRKRMVASGLALEGLYETKWKAPHWRQIDVADPSAINLVAFPTASDTAQMPRGA